MKFGTKNVPYNAADGETYNAGDFKPVWKQVQKNLNLEIDDVTDSVTLSSIDSSFQAFQALGFKTQGGKQLNLLQGNASSIVEEGTANGTILDLKPYMDQGKLPNLKRFLEENPVVAKSIIANGGQYFYAPYFDGYNDIEKMLMLRKDYVEKLLDGEYTASKYDTETTINPSYTRFNAAAVDQDVDVLNEAGNGAEKIHKKYVAGQDIVTIQNGLTTKNGQNLVKALRDYIDTTYNHAYGTKRSELFIGRKAAYNMDELVALFRAAKANPKLLTGKADGVIYPLTPREQTNDRTTDLFNFMINMGVRGINGRQTYFYVGNDGNLVDTRSQEAFVTALGKMHDLYSEGLILPNFDVKGADGVTGSTKWSTDLFQASDAKDTTKARGLAIYDYCQTQTAFNWQNTGMELVPVMPAGYAWNGTNETKFVESWRGVKTSGWFITDATKNDADKLERALLLVDYFYGAEGNKLMSYGPAAWINGTTKYMGKDIPKLSDACLSEFAQLGKYNYTNYYRQFLGGTLAVGYVKEQGMEYQVTNPTARNELDKLENALAYNVIKHPNALMNNTADHMLDQLPSSIAFTAAESSSISETMADLGGLFSTSKGKVNVMTDVVKNGFGARDGKDAKYVYTDAASFTNWVKSTLKSDEHLRIINTAYHRMGFYNN